MEIKKLILPLFICGILVLSTFGIVFSDLGDDSGNTYVYNDIRFIKKGNLWSFKHQEKEYKLLFGPKDLENVSLDINIYDIFNAGKIYVSVDPRENVGSAMNELISNIKSLLGVPIVGACRVDIEECNQFPLKTCNDASASEKIIVIKPGESSVTYKDNCLVIEGDSITQVKYADKIILKTAGVF